MNYDPVPGMSIEDAAADLATIVSKYGEPASMTFNEIFVTADVGATAESIAGAWWAETNRRAQAWKESPKGKAAAAERVEEIRTKQARVDELMAALPAGEAAWMEWVHEFAQVADDIGVHFDRGALADALERAGWVANAEVGRPREHFQTRPAVARYIMGQAISCLRAGMPPHPITLTFVERWRKL